MVRRLVAVTSLVFLAGCGGDGSGPGGSGSACRKATEACAVTADCCTALICTNNVCAAPPVCRAANETCSVTSDCCNPLVCVANKCGQIGSGTGGAPGSGGVPGSGGAPGTGGRNSTGGTTGSGGVTGTGGVDAGDGGMGDGVDTGGTGTGGAILIDTARYNFESTTQGWANSAINTDSAFSGVFVSTAQHFAGSSSLAGTITNSPSGSTPYYLEILLSSNLAAPTFVIPASATVTFHAYVPTGALITTWAAFFQEGSGAPTPFRSTTVAGLVVPGNWATLVVNVPADVTPLTRIGVVFNTTGVWTGTVFVDSVNW